MNGGNTSFTWITKRNSTQDLEKETSEMFLNYFLSVRLNYIFWSLFHGRTFAYVLFTISLNQLDLWATRGARWSVCLANTDDMGHQYAIIIKYIFFLNFKVSLKLLSDLVSHKNFLILTTYLLYINLKMNHWWYYGC